VRLESIQRLARCLKKCTLKISKNRTGMSICFWNSFDNFKLATVQKNAFVAILKLIWTYINNKTHYITLHYIKIFKTIYWPSHLQSWSVLHPRNEAARVNEQVKHLWVDMNWPVYLLWGHCIRPLETLLALPGIIERWPKSATSIELQLANF